MIQIMPISHVVANAEVSREDIKKVMPGKRFHPDQKFVVPVMHVQMGSQAFICCMAGGEMSGEDTEEPRLLREEDDIKLTPLGELIMRTAGRFVAPGGRLILREVKCDGIEQARITEKVMETLRIGQTGDLIVFIGDMAGACDGCILPVFNLVGGIELPILKGMLGR